MTHGSLFSGIGGFDLAAEWMGWENKFHCEINPFGQRILKHYWPDAESYTDITTTDFTIWRGRIDIVSGGFPCQPYSHAGKRKGTNDERHLWPSMLRAIGEIQPGWIVGENVPGLISWEGGMVLKQIKTDLENKGFEVFPPLIIPACGKDAPHRRERLWIVAHTSGFQRNTKRTEKQQRTLGRQSCSVINRIIEQGVTPYSDIQGLPFGFQSGIWKTERKNESYSGCKSARRITKSEWKQFPTQSPLWVRNDGFPGQLDGITVSKWRTESLKAAGNAVVPQVVFEIFKAIELTYK